MHIANSLPRDGPTQKMNIFNIYIYRISTIYIYNSFAAKSDVIMMIYFLLAMASFFQATCVYNSVCIEAERPSNDTKQVPEGHPADASHLPAPTEIPLPGPAEPVSLAEVSPSQELPDPEDLEMMMQELSAAMEDLEVGDQKEKQANQGKLVAPAPDQRTLHDLPTAVWIPRLRKSEPPHDVAKPTEPPHDVGASKDWGFKKQMVHTCCSYMFKPVVQSMHMCIYVFSTLV